MAKYLWILTGANGSGKSTFYKKYLKDLGLAFVNADEIAKESHPQGTAKASWRPSQKLMSCFIT